MIQYNDHKTGRGGSRILENWGPTLEDFEASRRRERSDAEGVAGEECERRLNPLSLGGLPQKLFQIWVLSPAI